MRSYVTVTSMYGKQLCVLSEDPLRIRLRLQSMFSLEDAADGIFRDPSTSRTWARVKFLIQPRHIVVIKQISILHTDGV